MMGADDGRRVGAMRTRPSGAQAERARQLLASEGDCSSTEACAAAAGRVYDKLAAELVPLLGPAGAHSLFMRSAKLAQSELGSLAGSGDSLESATRLRACLQSLELAGAIETAAILLGTFLELVTTFIGERLTVQVLRKAWPGIQETAPKGTHK
jgi:hypothetical protein